MHIRGLPMNEQGVHHRPENSRMFVLHLYIYETGSPLYHCICKRRVPKIYMGWWAGRIGYLGMYSYIGVINTREKHEAWAALQIMRGIPPLSVLLPDFHVQIIRTLSEVLESLVSLRRRLAKLFLTCVLKLWKSLANRPCLTSQLVAMQVVLRIRKYM